ncbi:MFS domain-containing protein [Fusarium falciforme]|uniref:MFS domain-containing protein n=1 Tax=Fusarium falciforme TaxID=195108 RepID=UPI00230030D4|nr:MFS domain-containing protein [Fusarium falciforme]WAO94830.1 MFS domain-containing protein [Fusarium falciforme]
MKTWLSRGKGVRVGITICCLIAFVLFGYDQGVFGGILQNEDWLNQFDHPSDSKTGIIVSCYNLGCLTGCIINFFTADKLGRRMTIWVAMALVIVGATLQATAYNVPHLVIGRVVTGFGTGMKTSTVPMYQSELCEAKYRGRLIASESLFVGVGIVFAYWFDFGLSYAGGAMAWRLPLAFQIVFALLVVVLVFALPDSPRWLFQHGRRDDAIAVMCYVYDKDVNDAWIIEQTKAIEAAIELEAEAQVSLVDCFKNDRVKTGSRVMMAWGMQLMNQLGGINLVVYYVPSVLVTNVGTTAHMAQILGGCIQIMFMVGAILPALALDRMGRRKTMMWGSFGLGFCMMMVAILLSQAKNASNGEKCASAAVAFFFLYQLFFGFSVNCVPWVYVPEILPLKARARGTAVGISSNWMWNFVIVMLTPILIERIGWKSYLIFAITNYLFVVATWWFFPETSNLDLEMVDNIFASGENPVTVAERMQKELKEGRLRPMGADSSDNEKVVEDIKG